MNEIERDREVDAAWRAASREEPPPALDAAIRAQARRAVDAAPGGARSKHWWYPLAAAATVAALAIGIAQLTPPEQVAPTVVAEQSAAPRQTANEVARQSTPADATLAAPPPAAPVATPASSALAQKAPTQAAGAAQGVTGRRQAEAAPAAQAFAKKQDKGKTEEAPTREKLAAVPSTPDASAAAAVGGASASSPAPPRSEPFPAKSARPETRGDVYAEAPSVAPNAPAGAAEARASRRAPAAAEVKSRLAVAKVTNIDEAKAKDAGARSVEDWLKRIRELKNEGRVDDAAKELTAFRSAFGERADALLPPDLRAWTPAGVAPAAK
jgi:hypothetical protein